MPLMDKAWLKAKTKTFFRSCECGFASVNDISFGFLSILGWGLSDYSVSSCAP
jgi:hypothetical protein